MIYEWVGYDLWVSLFVIKMEQALENKEEIGTSIGD